MIKSATWNLTRIVSIGTATCAIAMAAGCGNAGQAYSPKIGAPILLPDFTMGAMPASNSTTAGSSATYTVAALPVYGFTSSIALSASGLPAGATAQFTPNGSNEILTITTSSSGTVTPVGSYTITITGTGGGKTHSLTVGLTVTAAQDFTITATPASISSYTGNTFKYTVTVTSVNGLSTPVNLTVSGTPLSSTPTFSPTAVTPTTAGATSTLSIGTSASTTPFGTYPLTITGTEGGVTHTTTVTMITYPG